MFFRFKLIEVIEVIELVFNLPNVVVQIVKCNCPNYIKTQLGMANFLTVRANRREMLVFNLHCTLAPI